MQYKFIVDGEWRHDAHLPIVSGNYGEVHTVFVGGESGCFPPILIPEIQPGSNMDVDNEAFQRVVCEPDYGHELFFAAGCVDFNFFFLSFASL